MNTLPGLLQEKGQLLVANSTPGKALFTEQLVEKDGKECRIFSPRNSKLAAGIIKGIALPQLNESDRILYLGAAHGYTVSFLADMFRKGMIWAVEFSPIVARDLLFTAQQRSNIIPLIEDAAHPERYMHAVIAADVIFQDIAQQNQAEIFLRNVDMLLAAKGNALLAVKARSIDVTAKPQQIFRQVREKLEAELIVEDWKPLEPFQRDHALFVCRKRK